jgi:hypothetical protein
MEQNVRTKERLVRRSWRFSDSGEDGDNNSLCSFSPDNEAIEVGCPRIKSMKWLVKSLRSVAKWAERAAGERDEKIDASCNVVVDPRTVCTESDILIFNLTSNILCTDGCSTISPGKITMARE